MVEVVVAAVVDNYTVALVAPHWMELGTYAHRFLVREPALSQRTEKKVTHQSNEK